MGNEVASLSDRRLEAKARTIGKLYRDATESVGQVREQYVELMNASILKAVKAGELLKEHKGAVGHGGWLPWLKDNKQELGFGRTTAVKLMAAADRYHEYANEPSTAYLDAVECEDFLDRLWGNESRGGSSQHRIETSGDNEWYTPPTIIEMARNTMGGIDLDPASSSKANKSVRAGVFYSEKDDGLSKEWFGRVWLNPPYSKDMIGAFCEKLIEEIQSGAVKSAIMLVNNNTETEWAHRCCEAAAAVCWHRGRIKFFKDDEESASPTQGQVLFLFTKSKAMQRKFAQEFGEVGFIWEGENV